MVVGDAEEEGCVTAAGVTGVVVGPVVTTPGGEEALFAGELAWIGAGVEGTDPTDPGEGKLVAVGVGTTAGGVETGGDVTVGKDVGKFVTGVETLGREGVGFVIVVTGCGLSAAGVPAIAAGVSTVSVAGEPYC